MDTQIVVVFCLCDDMLKALHHYEDSQCQMSDAEVMTTAIVAMLYFKGNFCLASQLFVRIRLHSKHAEPESLQSPIASDCRFVFDLVSSFGRDLEETQRKIGLCD